MFGECDGSHMFAWCVPGVVRCRLAGGGDDGPGWWGACCGRGCSSSDVSVLPVGTTNI